MRRQEPFFKGDMVKKQVQTLALLGLAAMVLGLIPRAALAADAWPRRMEHPKGTVVMYQPQLESFQDDKLTGRAAVSAKKKEWKDPVFGVVWISARVATDRDARMVTVEEARVTDVKFPGITPEQETAAKAFLEKEMEGWDHELSLDRLLSMLEQVAKEKAGDQGLSTRPPKIIFVTHPAVLVLLDGEPKLRPLEKSSLMRVVNTPFLLVFDPAAKSYFLKGDAWLSAVDLKGPWKEVATLPEALKALDAQVEKQRAAQPAPEVKAQGEKMPQVIVSTEPAELIVSAGEPSYTPITGTNLLYLSNTEANVFLDPATQQYYVLLAGRWFASKSLKDGPWTYVAPDKLPADFARIPPASPKGFVRVSVAGTEEAKEAVMDNFIPQTAAIDRKKASTKVEYDGPARFEKIPGTDLEYAVNTGKAVFKSGDQYYCCDEGVWYEAAVPEGPWKVSVSVPQQVNSLPPSNPHYNAKYVKVYEATEDVAYVGYTPGYAGSYVQEGAVVYGTGYNYPAYASQAAYIPQPVTYGYAPVYDPYAGSWGYQPPYDPYAWVGPVLGFGAGMLMGAAIWGDHWYGGGWWGASYHNTININNIHNNVIHHWRPDGRPIIHPVVKPGERPGEHRPGNIYQRPENRAKLASRPEKPAVKPAGAAGPGKAERPAPVAKGPGKAGAAKPAPGRPAPPRAGQNNVFADKGGNVYRHTPQGWEQRQGNSWSKPAPSAATRPSPRPSPEVERPKPPAPRPATGVERPASRPSVDTGQLNRDFAARQRGEMRTQNFQRAMAAPSRPAGATHGGGGGRRR